MTKSNDRFGLKIAKMPAVSKKLVSNKTNGCANFDTPAYLYGRTNKLLLILHPNAIINNKLLEYLAHLRLSAVCNHLQGS